MVLCGCSKELANDGKNLCDYYVTGMAGNGTNMDSICLAAQNDTTISVEMCELIWQPEVLQCS